MTSLKKRLFGACRAVGEVAPMEGFVKGTWRKGPLTGQWTTRRCR